MVTGAWGKTQKSQFFSLPVIHAALQCDFAAAPIKSGACFSHFLNHVGLRDLTNRRKRRVSGQYQALASRCLGDF